MLLKETYALVVIFVVIFCMDCIFLALKKKRLWLPGLLIALLIQSVSGQLTTPESYLGFKPGADFKLATYEQWVGYMELLASETGRMEVRDMGSTSEGRRMKYAIISSEYNIANLEKFRQISERLSLAQDLSPEEAKSLSQEGKAIVWIDAGMHSSEVAPPIQQIQLAYDLVTGTDQRTESIRENTILLLVQANPDGMTIVADWYKKILGTPYESSSLPVLYHKYAGHDNNRDFMVANLVETRNMHHMVGKIWYPEVLYVQHQPAPFPARIWIPPNPEPVNPNQHPLIQRVKNLIGAAMGQQFDAEGKQGAISRISFDVFYAGYADGPAVDGHNIPSLLTETAGNRYATPKFFSVKDFPKAYQDLTIGSFYPSPWEGGWWRIGDAVDYTLTASKAVLDVAARYREELLYYKYQMATDVMMRFSQEPPYGWIFPIDQGDRGALELLLKRLHDYGVDIYRSDKAFTHEGIDYPQGTYIVPANQAFGLYAKNVLERQTYPDLRKYGHLWQGISRTIKWDGSPLTPYDGVGWTLPVQFGLNYHTMSSSLDAEKTRLDDVTVSKGSIKGKGDQYFLSASENNSYTAINQILQSKAKVTRSTESFTIGNTNYPRGSFIINNLRASANMLDKVAVETNATIQRGRSIVNSIPVPKRRVGLYKSWVANMDAGWLSLILENHSFDFQFITDAEMRAGNLSSRFEVIILPDQRMLSILNGHKKGTMPADYTGGISESGVENLQTFVESGGVLICNNNSSDLPGSGFNLTLKNVLKDVPADSFNCPGSLIKLQLNLEHPLTYGMKEKGMAYFSRGRAFDMPNFLEKESGNHPLNIAATYPDKPLLISGWMIGEERIQSKGAIVETSYGKGKIILFGFNIHNRAMALRNFKLLFNAIYFPVD